MQWESKTRENEYPENANYIFLFLDQRLQIKSAGEVECNKGDFHIVVILTYIHI